MPPQPALVLRRDVLHSWLHVSGYTQTQLARALNISKGRISQLLHSRDDEPSSRLIAGLLEVTRLPFDRLFSFHPTDRQAIERRMKQLTRRRRVQRQRSTRSPEAGKEAVR